MGDVGNMILRNWYGSVTSSGATVSDTVVSASRSKLYGLVVQATTGDAAATVYNGTTTGQTTSVIAELGVHQKGDSNSLFFSPPVLMDSGIVVQTTGARTILYYD